MLEARSLTKYYNHTPAVRQVSFTVRPGEILGYLGPNGAGKSTTVKMLTGLIEPSEGQIFYRGRSVYEDFTAFQRRIGYVPEEAHLYPHLSGREYLQLMGRLRGMPRRILDPKMDEFLRAFALWDDRHAPLSAYSKGMRQKILLSAALLHDPDVLVLDEPFSGLDVTAALMLRSLLRALAGQEKIILYSSHVLEVVEKICSKVLILRNGEVVAYDSIERLRELMSQPSLEGVFAQLTQADDGDEVANRIVDAMGFRGTSVRAPDPAIAAGLTLYRGLANGLPHEFKNVYGDELLQTAEDSIGSVWRRQGLPGLVRLLFDIAIRVPVEHLAELSKDTRYAFRSLAGSPGFTAVALLSLALAICIVTCAFSEMNGMALRTIPGVANPRELVALQLPASYPSYQRYRAHGDAFSSTLAYVAAVPFGVSLGGRTERKWGHLVTPSYFSTLGVHPALGRFFDDGGQQGPNTPVVVSYRFWQEQLASDPSPIGKTLRVNSQPATVVGVGPKEFLGASPVLFGADLWMPLSVGERMAPELAGQALERYDRTIFRVVGRLRPGVTMSRVEAELDAAAQQIEQENGSAAGTQKGRRVQLVEGGKMLPLRKQDLPFFTSFFTVMSGLIMLIACANVGNMMLARAAGRRKEIAVRLALGASRARIVRQLLTESMIVVAGAALPGFLGSMLLMRSLSGVRMPYLIPVTYDLQPDAKVLMLTIILTGLTALIFGLLPALHSTRTDLAPALKEGGNIRLSARRWWSLRNTLMVGQFAGSLTLLVILGLLSFGIQSTLGVQAGFNPKSLYLMSLDPVRDGYSGEQATAFLQKLLDRVKLLPSVTSASLTETVPVSIGGARVRVSAAGDATHETRTVIRHVVGKDYFETTGIALPAGRPFRKEDETSQTAAVIVSREFARQFWQGSDPLGREIEIGNDEIVPSGILPGTYDYRVGGAAGRRKLFEVVGVAGDVAEGLVVQKPSPVIYFPLRPADYAMPAAQGVTLMVRATPGVDVMGAVRREIAAIDPGITPFNIRSMPGQIEQFMAPLRLSSWTYGCIGIFGLVLSAVGLAGMTAYSVARRGREIGIRIALGAQKGNVLGLVMKEGMLLVLAGTAIGMAGAWTGSRLLSAMNSSVGKVTSTSTTDPAVLFGAPLLLAFLALLACYFPARKSMRIDPVVALRQE
jgi:predicted permease